jgi:hypothetical protein
MEVQVPAALPAGIKEYVDPRVSLDVMEKRNICPQLGVET